MFNHPEPSNPMPFMPSTTTGQESFAQSYRWKRTSFIASPHYQDPLSYGQHNNPQGLVQLPSWNTFPMSGNDRFAGTSRQNIRAMDHSASFSSLQRGSIFPVRPGEPDCRFFMKTGDCKFGVTCRFNHPIQNSPDCMLNPKGFPLRPGKPQCMFYSRFGTCKYGPTCKFDHPITAPMGTITASLSTSSTSEAPSVQQYQGHGLA